MKTNFVPRVNQLDSIQLDSEIQNLLRQQIQNILQCLPPGLLSHLQPEINFVLNSALWNFSLPKSYATFGQQMLSIAYEKDQLPSAKLGLHYLLTTLLPYIKESCQFRLTSWSLLQRVLSVVENALVLFNLLNFFKFLKSGKQPSLVDCLLRINHRSLDGAKRRTIGYSYMTRELVWAGFMELLGFTIPFINYHSLKRKLRNALRLDPYQQPVERVELTSESKCAYCNERVILPHHMGCSHVFCYYCLKGNQLADEGFECNVCDYRSDSFKKVLVL
ncbi:peroxisome biogenesis factor 2 [Anopheles ziemanni]|uniref:peroxisome biogenesis factor 2 n=1 Tax=Anopheles coustani TaxID=139045 RepID=UPI002659BF4B|nr:peroxisome biogenesis factor 2 [Anopheles coustani]XP_058171303.1 peroxisome biogenesis factor 2 [Anopheles ziemanni]